MNLHKAKEFGTIYAENLQPNSRVTKHDGHRRSTTGDEKERSADMTAGMITLGDLAQHTGFACAQAFVAGRRAPRKSVLRANGARSYGYDPRRIEGRRLLE